MGADDRREALETAPCNVALRNAPTGSRLSEPDKA